MRGNGGAGVGMFAAVPGGATYNNIVIANTAVDDGQGGINIHSHAPGQNVSGNVISNNVISNGGVDPDSGTTLKNGISIVTAVVPLTETVSGNRISNEGRR